MSVFGSDPRDSKRPEPPGGNPWLLPAGWLASDTCRLSSYLPFEALAAGKKILDINGLPAAKERLRRAGARTVMGAGDPPWDLQPESVDVLFALGELEGASETLLREVARVLVPDGFAVLRFPAVHVASSSQLASTLTAVFAAVDLMAQVPIAGFTFDAGGSPGVVVAEDLFPMGAQPSHWIALCAAGAVRPWAGLDSWLIPLARPAQNPSTVAAGVDRQDRPELEFRLAELTREREYLREMLMTVQDDRDRLERLAANLRRDADRGLARASEQAAALEVLSLERDQALRKAAAPQSVPHAPAPLPDFDGPQTQPTSA